jgi:hypothetical protein
MHKWRTLTEQLDLSISQLPYLRYTSGDLTEQLDLSIPLNIDEESVIVTIIQKDQYTTQSLDWFYDVERYFQQYFSYIVAVSFIGG